MGGICYQSSSKNYKEDDIKTIKKINEYEDKHIKVKVETTKEIVNGNLKNFTEDKYIYNKDGYYKAKMLLPSGKDD